jgi:hypothetical protein
MIHDEIASSFYAKLNGVGVPVFKHVSNTAGERIVIQVKANTIEILQTAQVWILVYADTINNLPNMTRLNQLKQAIENALVEPFTAPSGEVLLVEPISIDGPFVDPQIPSEAYLILRYRVKAR